MFDMMIKKMTSHGTVLAVTAMPGVQRAVAMWLIARVCGLEVLGRVASDLGIVMLIGCFTALGWCALLLIRLPRLRPSRKAQMYVAVAVRSAWLALLTAPLLWALAKYDVVFSWLGTFVYLFSWSAYQLARHYWLTAGAYARLLIVELCGLFFMGASLIVVGSTERDVLFALSIPPLLAAVALFVALIYQARCAGLSPYRSGKAIWSTSQGLGLSNALTGGVAAALTPIVRFAAGDGYAGMIAIVTSVVSVMMLIPRALSFQQIIPLTKSVGDCDWSAVRRRVEAFRRDVLAALLVLAVVVSIFWFAGAYRAYSLERSHPALHLAFLFSLATFLISQVVLPEANLVIALERVQAQLTINVISVVLFAVGVGIVLLARQTEGKVFVFLLLVNFFSALLRSVGIAVATRRMLSSFR